MQRSDGVAAGLVDGTRVAASCFDKLYEEVASNSLPTRHELRSMPLDALLPLAMLHGGAPLWPAFSRFHEAHPDPLADWRMQGACGEMPGSLF